MVSGRSFAFPGLGVYAVPHLNLLDHSACDVVHRASLEILRRTGIAVLHQGAFDLLVDGGARVVGDDRVSISAELVQWALGCAPSRVTLCHRGGDRPAVPLEARRVSFGPGSDCPNYLDPRSGERRKFTRDDLVACIQLVDVLPELDFCMSMGIPPDVNGESPYRAQFALMLEHTTKPIVFVCDGLADCEAIVQMAAAAAGGLPALRLNPSIVLYSEPSTPLTHSETATAKLLAMAEYGLPVVHSPAPMMGGTAPVTLAGGYALGNAEVLSSLVIHQLKNPGAPFVYGVQAHHLDMKTTISVYGAPIYQLARAMSAEMGRFYGLPTWGNAGMSDSCVMDEQAAADAAVSVLLALLTGTNLVHDVGYLEAGLTTSPEMMVFTAEMIGAMRRFAKGVSLDGESLALEVIDQVGPGGDFLGTDHTMAHFREFWQPSLLSRVRVGDWIAGGRRPLRDRLREKTVALMDRRPTGGLPDKVREGVEKILHRE